MEKSFERSCIFDIFFFNWILDAWCDLVYILTWYYSQKLLQIEQMELKNMKHPGFIPCADIVKLKQGVQHDKRVEEVKQNLTVYGVYLTILLILVYGQCDSNSYLVQNTMTTNVVSHFQKVWMHILIDIVFIVVGI